MKIHPVRTGSYFPFFLSQSKRKDFFSYHALLFMNSVFSFRDSERQMNFIIHPQVQNEKTNISKRKLLTHFASSRGEYLWGQLLVKISNTYLFKLLVIDCNYKEKPQICSKFTSMCTHTSDFCLSIDVLHL